MSVISSIYKRLCLISPWVEVSLRKIYWNNYRFLKRFKAYSMNVTVENTNAIVNFDDILSYLKEQGVQKGDLLIVHSSYDNLKGTGLRPIEIIEKLKDLVGPSGTIAMPAIRTFKNEPPPENLLKEDLSNIVIEYDVLRTPVSSGLLPFTLLRMQGSCCSHFPFNPLVAIGPLAKQMMENNISTPQSSAHGKDSCWKFCLDHGAKIVSLGVDLDHHNTMLHVMEEAFDNWRWSDDDWFITRTCDIIDENKVRTRIKVRERKPIWGMIYNAEVRMYKAFYDDNIIRRKYFNSIPVCYEHSKDLMSHLQERNKNGYPYYKF